MAGTHDNRVSSQAGVASIRGGNPRPSQRTVAMWTDANAALRAIRQAEFLLGLLPEKPAQGAELVIDLGAVALQLMDARIALGDLALALSDGES